MDSRFTEQQQERLLALVSQHLPAPCVDLDERFDASELPEDFREAWHEGISAEMMSMPRRKREERFGLWRDSKWREAGSGPFPLLLPIL